MTVSLSALSPVILVVLAFLGVISVGSWTILVWKTWQLGRVRRANRGFLGFFDRAPNLDAVAREVGQFGDSPLAALVRDGWNEVPQGLESVSRSLRRSSTVEIETLERGVSFLATTASSTPFIGLFGTVWGIMSAFQKIGDAGSTSLAIVAPGISEALVTTAIGLAVAIPAGIGYNFLQGRVRRLTSEIDNFSYDLLNLLHRSLGSGG